MDVVVICNGLGNQMSQYAFYLNKKAIAGNTRFIFDRRSSGQHNGYELDRIFGINYKEGYLERLLCFLLRILEIKKFAAVTRPTLKILRFMGLRLINENYDYNFHKDYLVPSSGINFYYGGWHNQKYFLDVQDQVKKSFAFKLKDIPQDMNEVISRIRATNSIAVHIRRGDFLTGINYSMFGAVCTVEYFENAILTMQQLVANPHFFVFTNDIDWAQKRFQIDNFEVVTCNRGRTSWRDMYLISLCKHCINSNSSFSWWGAWLNLNPGRKVIVPPYFLNNIIDDAIVYPSDWIRVSNA